MDNREKQTSAGVSRALLPWADVTLFPFLSVVLQVGLVLAVMHVFHIEEKTAFLKLTPLVFGGFVVHALLPRTWRQPFFVLLSLSAFFVLLDVRNALLLIGTGVGLIGICHLPIRVWQRVMLVVLASAGLAWMRAGGMASERAEVILPILGAMFMFRLAVYLYDVPHERTKATLWERLSYFFMLPNLTFPLFPVVDYQTFRRTYYNTKDAVDIYQKGVLWMFRGVTHLLIYRVVYHYVVIAPSEATSLATVVQYMVATYLLYLRISGLFHLIVGILCLFGFNLPETHKMYYLASSFNDYWRRINIYWKDFMMKLFYYPAFTIVKRWGMVTGLALATLWVFFGTWLLHAYQWFWLRGTFHVTWPDTLFWGILGALVVFNAIREAQRGRPRKRLGLTPKQPTWDTAAAVRYAAQVTGMFVVITVLWSMWSSTSLAEFAGLLRVAASSSLAEWGVLAAGLVALVVIGVGVQWLTFKGVRLTFGAVPARHQAQAYTLAGSLVLLVMAYPQVYPSSVAPQVAAVAATLNNTGLNQRDAEMLDRGYYEGLLETNAFTTALWEDRVRMPSDWTPLQESGLVDLVGGPLRYTLVPNADMMYHRARTTTNRWGMRDQDYAREKPANTFRMALLGASIEMGSAVRDHEVFLTIAEDSLNALHEGNPPVEILNFAVGGYCVMQYTQQMADEVPSFAPDVVMVAGHSGDGSRSLYVFREWLREGVPLLPELENMLQRAGVDASMSDADLRQRLVEEELEYDLLRWGYRTIAERARGIGAVPVYVYVPRTDGLRRGERPEELIRIAEEAGLFVFDLRGAYAGLDERLLHVAPWDAHPNPKGHRLLAEQLVELVQTHAATLGLAPAAVALSAPQKQN